MTKLERSNCDQTQKLKLYKTKKSNCDNSKTQIVMVIIVTGVKVVGIVVIIKTTKHLDNR